jgi:hypothetical protein
MPRTLALGQVEQEVNCSAGRWDRGRGRGTGRPAPQSIASPGQAEAFVPALKAGTVTGSSGMPPGETRRAGSDEDRIS